MKDWGTVNYVVAFGKKVNSSYSVPIIVEKHPLAVVAECFFFGGGLSHADDR